MNKQGDYDPLGLTKRLGLDTTMPDEAGPVQGKIIYWGTAVSFFSILLFILLCCGGLVFEAIHSVWSHVG